jgi:hypothetical protein
MNRQEFESLRDLPNKTIEGDIVFTQPRDTPIVFVAAKIPIISTASVRAYLDIRYVTETDYCCFNVTIEGTGQVCRLEHNANNHGKAGRDHKHSLQTEECPMRNLPHADDFAGLQDKTPKEIFKIFCKAASINHQGSFHEPWIVSGRKKL